MNSKLKFEMDNQPVATTEDAALDAAELRAMALEMVRQDSRDNPTDYLRETEAPFGGE